MTSGPGNPPEALITALLRLLRPLVRLLIAHNIGFPTLSRLLKSVYVDVALREFPLTGKEQTDSRISLLTGVHRKDVKRLRTQSEVIDELPQQVSLGAQLVAAWTGVSRFLDEAGKPRVLPRLSLDGEEPSFEELVTMINKDIRPRAVLDEWLRLKLVTALEGDRLRLNVAAFVPETGFEEKAHYFGQNLRDHIAAGADNLGGRQPPFFDRSLFSDALSAAGAEQLEIAAKEGAMAMLQELSRAAMASEQDDPPEPGGRQRVNIGIYVYREPLDDASPQDGDDE
jgi:hypothetical protein